MTKLKTGMDQVAQKLVKASKLAIYLLDENEELFVYERKMQFSIRLFYLKSNTIYRSKISTLIPMAPFHIANDNMQNKTICNSKA